MFFFAGMIEILSRQSHSMAANLSFSLLPISPCSFLFGHASVLETSAPFPPKQSSFLIVVHLNTRPPFVIANTAHLARQPPNSNINIHPLSTVVLDSSEKQALQNSFLSSPTNRSSFCLPKRDEERCERRNVAKQEPLSHMMLLFQRSRSERVGGMQTALRRTVWRGRDCPSPLALSHCARPNRLNETWELQGVSGWVLGRSRRDANLRTLTDNQSFVLHWKS
ncbi:hypothetical protein BLNAU_16181 [Blattamonas nauphoetae]|uniref:Uncharacterized protein n=1 Tax=Blattamonas nauphoetae TaxID=2049346 RepID=A0ABQ9X8P3_9EUKA|nr:hypothetical protein BLNAU_16181 [Blattamonas nauphoetae]